ncbi:MAG TPA: sensor histidine kinase [Casimicrobiaceae bacterium]|nr:sensor histidine kinase [Casimicrobiaceae bacterium]
MPQKLADFIRENHELILVQWDAYARGLHVGLNDKALRNDAARLLTFVANDMGTPQTSHEQQRKSQGRGETSTTTDRDVGTATSDHAIHRHRLGFDINQMVSEYRALRATVIRLWLAEDRVPTTALSDELVRFNEAIDQVVAESVAQFGAEVDASRQLFLGTLGHDLRSPMSAIHATMTAWAMDPGTQPNDKVRVDRVLRAVNRMRSMISDLLDFTRTQRGTRLPIDPERCNLGEVVETVIEEVEAATGVILEKRFEGDLVGNWDCSRMGQLASNLISNAVTHGAASAPPQVTLRGLPGKVQLQVANSGSTISPERQRTIFEPLGRNPDATTHHNQGLGLGLYICKHIVEAHGGTIVVDSSAELGTRVRVELPRERDVNAEP